MFAFRLRSEGIDVNHMSMDRIDGRRSPFGPSFHAMHHVEPTGFYSSFLNVFDVIFGTALTLRGKRVLLTGEHGAYGSKMKAALEKRGAIVSTLQVRHNEPMPSKGALGVFDILVLAHGLNRGNEGDIWGANFYCFAQLGDDFIEAGAGKLVPPEIWAVGSEAEVLGSSDYAASKRAFANYAAENWFHSADVTYRHIVPSAFCSAMGWGLMTAGFAVAWSMFLISRGFRYIPVTYTGLALINRVRFLRWVALAPPKPRRRRASA